MKFCLVFKSFSSVSPDGKMKLQLKVMGIEKKGGVKVVSIDRSCFKDLSLLIFYSFSRTLAL